MFQILVVEDDRELCDLFCTVLTDNGYTAVPAADGIAAFDVLDSTNIDLIVSDVMMPRMYVSIADNGTGMSAEVKRRVFEKFYQGDSSRSSQGNGLGLALAKRIIDLHHGEITVSSKENKGTTFVVSLPIVTI